MAQCAKCGIQVSELVTVDAELINKLASSGESIPPQVCAGCLNDLKKKAAIKTGSILMAQEKAKEQHRMQLWKNRVNLIKQARLLMGQKQYAEAAIHYEKYLKILEIVFEVKKGQTLAPELFKESARTTELTVVTSTYWDLIRIYDTHPRYLERQKVAAKQLAVFAKFTPIYSDIARKAEIFARSAKNDEAAKLLTKLLSSEKSRCFIATSAFNSAYADEVIILRHFRDHVLLNNFLGDKFVSIYYHISPHIACVLDKHPRLKPFVRWFLRMLIKCVS